MRCVICRGAEVEDRLTSVKLERGEVDPGYLPLQRLLSNSRGAQPGALAEPRFQRLLARVHALASR